MKKIIIFGATGFIGKELVTLLQKDYEVFVVSRNKQKAKQVFNENINIIEWAGDEIHDKKPFQNAYAMINLIGENVGSGYWTKKKKDKILNSRKQSTRRIVDLINTLKNKPETIIQGSAVGYYGSYSEMEITEESSKGNGFLSEVTEQSEDELNGLPENIRKIFLRTGVVIGKGGGLVKSLMIPFKLFIGGPLGNGKQWFPWIHMKDEIEAIKFLLENTTAEGVYNLVSPNPVRQKDFMKAFGKTINRPSYFKVPAFFLKAVFGEMAREMFLKSQKVKPKRLLEAGYSFHFVDVNTALNDLIKK